MTKLQTSKYASRSYWCAHGQRLRLARSVLSITEREAAAAHGVTLRTYRRWERGGPQTNSSRGLTAFCKAYGVSVDWLMLGRAHFV